MKLLDFFKRKLYVKKDIFIWDKDLKWIRENADKLNDIKNFMK